jgi:hypothetical protein
MSDGARDLLVRGIAAAKGGQPEEARFHLEWVLRTDADLDQQTEAWYWLSTIATEPKEQRECLENVLAMNPLHPEARRDLAILEGRLSADQVPDARYVVAPLTPDTTLDPEEIQRSKCPRCGAHLSATGASGELRCQFCGYSPETVGVGSEHAPSGVEEQDWIAAIYTIKGHRWEIPTERMFTCRDCGATIALPPSAVSTVCTFCGQPHVLPASSQPELLAPTAIGTFALNVAGARLAVRAWLGEQRFADHTLKDAATISEIRPMFVPFWTFDIHGEVRWSGYEVRSEFGRQTRVPVSGNVPVLFDDVLVIATTLVPPVSLLPLDFDTSKLLPYAPQLLASWPALIYNISVADASLTARERALNGPETQSLISLDTAGMSTIQDRRVERADLAVISYKLILLPVWWASYTFEGNSYPVVVNGQSGQVEGAVPRNPWQNFLNNIFED